MKDIFLHSACTISIQNTSEDDYFYEEIQEYQKNAISVIDPDYKAYIPAMQLRRMGKSMRMAVYASQKAIERAGNPKIEAVITGTGEGCLRDSEKFVEALWENEGGMLNPTPFIQSTHNMAAATVALALGCKGYNMTYTNNSNSFESAVLDAQLYLMENPDHAILIGGLDEVSEQTVQFWNKAGFINQENPGIARQFPPHAKGEVVAEGAGFYVASAQNSPNSLGKIKAVKTSYEPESSEKFVRTFLEENSISPEKIDAVLLGMNGDSPYDEIYQSLNNSLFENTAQVVFKNLIGEFDTVTSVAIEIALKIFQHQSIPSNLHYNEKSKDSYQRILLYNQRRGKNHSLILLEK